MRNRYEAVMAHVTVDDAMRERVLHHIAAVDLEPASRQHTAFPWRWAAAACIALLLLGGVMVQRFESPLPAHPDTHAPGTVTVVSPITQVDTAEALEELVGFPVDPLAGLPFEPESMTYSAIHKTIAQSVYQGGTESAVLRKVRGTEDPSGDYSDYEQKIPLKIAQVTGELQGNENSFTDAWWTDGTYAWSLSLSEPAAESEWLDLIVALLDSRAE